MAAQVAHHAIVVLVGMLLDGPAYLVDAVPGFGSLHTYLQTFFGHTHQLFLLRSGLTYYIHTRGVGIVAVQNGGKVDIDDVALFQDVLGLGNAVTHHLVDAGADTHGEWRRLAVLHVVVQTGGYGSVLLTVVATDLVYLQRRHTSMNLSTYLVQYAVVDYRCASYALYLFWGFDEVARRHLPPLVFHVHDAFVKLCRLFAWLAMPSSFYHSFLFLLCKGSANREKYQRKSIISLVFPRCSLLSTDRSKVRISEQNTK